MHLRSGSLGRRGCVYLISASSSSLLCRVCSLSPCSCQHLALSDFLTFAMNFSLYIQFCLKLFGRGLSQTLQFQTSICRQQQSWEGFQGTGPCLSESLLKSEAVCPVSGLMGNGSSSLRTDVFLGAVSGRVLWLILAVTKNLKLTLDI